jgi:hypothetical protein
MIENKSSSLLVYNYKAEDRETKFYEDFFDINVFFTKTLNQSHMLKF